MTYRDNVTALANEMGISNDPGLREEDLGIGGLHFYNDFGGRTRILGEEMNRASRLFLQRYATTVSEDSEIIQGHEFMKLKISASVYFAELWEDNTTPRQLLDAFKKADCVVIFWKSKVTWLERFNWGLPGLPSSASHIP